MIGIYAFNGRTNKMPAAPKAFQEAYPYAEFHVVNRENYLEFV